MKIAPVIGSWTPAIEAKRVGRRTPPRQVHLVDVSVSGARLMSHSLDHITVGEWMVLDIEDCHTVVEVRRIEANADRSTFTFGVVFVLLAPVLQHKIYDIVARSRAHQLASESGP